MILLIDSYDSFIFNLDQGLAALGATTCVVRNDAITPAGVRDLAPDAVVFGPGPGRPETTPGLLEILAALSPHTPFLGVCLGHQALVVAEGGALEHETTPMHGKSSPVHHDGSALFDGLASPLVAGRYHSLVAARGAIPASLEVSAWTESGTVMAVRHRTLPRFGIQFHPESILTPRGGDILARFVSLAGVPLAAAGAAGGVR